MSTRMGQRLEILRGCFCLLDNLHFIHLLVLVLIVEKGTFNVSFH